MCEVLDRVEQRGMRQGIQQGMRKGISIGELNKARDTTLRLRALNISDAPAAVAQIVGVEPELVERWFAETPK